MKHHSRRDVLRELGMGAAVFSVGTGSARAEDTSAEDSSEIGNAKSRPGMLMAIAAHPGDALFPMRLAAACGSLAMIGQKDSRRFKYAVALMSPPDYDARRTGSLSSPAITG